MDRRIQHRSLGDLTSKGGELKAGIYPPLLREGEEQVDFELSGTLFLDEVLNVEPEIQRMLLQAISYDPRRRFVQTTGLTPRRVPVGATLVSATAHWPEAFSRGEEGLGSRSSEGTRGVARTQRLSASPGSVRGFRIPPLRERKDEIEPILKHLVQARTGCKEVELEGNCKNGARPSCNFHNNVRRSRPDRGTSPP